MFPGRSRQTWRDRLSRPGRNSYCCLHIANTLVNTELRAPRGGSAPEPAPSPRSRPVQRSANVIRETHYLFAAQPAGLPFSGTNFVNPAGMLTLEASAGVAKSIDVRSFRYSCWVPPEVRCHCCRRMTSST